MDLPGDEYYYTANFYFAAILGICTSQSSHIQVGP
jgi:hypothetical protein